MKEFSKPKTIRLIGGLLLAAVALAVSGCATPEEESTVPWSQPAGWEGRVPGMPGS